MKEESKYKDLHNKGFSLVEIVVIIAIMIVLLAILTPSILRYVENSRMQKDDSAMDEVCHGILLALSDSEIFDEAVSYSIPNNYVTYTDSSGVYGAKYTDEEFWAPDGSGNAVTITFNPDENGTYTLANGLVNDMTYGNGSVADSRTAEDVKQCYFSEMGQQKLYHKVEQTIGSTFSEKSATYQNSSYTVFITFDVVNGIKRANVYGEWNGTNLDPSCPASLGSGTNSYTEDKEPEQTKTGGTTQSNYTSSDLQGGGGTSGSVPSYKQDDLPCGHKPSASGNHDKLPCDHYACRCDCEPAPCGVEGHLTGDGMNHEKLECGHYGCLCSGCIIPEGGKYTTADGTVYGPGDSFPEVSIAGDTYTYDGYQYRYKYRKGWGSWIADNAVEGWGVAYTKHTKAPPPILNKVNNLPVVNMNYTFAVCTSMEIAPVIPETITSMYDTFYHCYALTTVPAIPSGVKDMTFTFNGCESLTGTLTINASPSAYNNCFIEVDFQAQKLTLAGSCAVLDRVGATGINYCTECNGYCYRSEPVFCFVEGHHAGDGKNHTIKVDKSNVTLTRCHGGHLYTCECSGWIVPEGCTYKLQNGVVYTEGQELPCTYSPNNSDDFIEGPYSYEYWPQYGGWKLTVTDKTLTEYGPIRETINNKPVGDISRAFMNCTAMVKAPNIPEGVLDMEYAFYKCTSLKTPPAYIPSTITDMQQAFAYCSQLLSTPDMSKATSVTTMYYAYAQCTSLKTASSLANCTQLTNMKQAFYYCSALTTAPVLSNSVEDLSYAYQYCSSLTTIPDMSNAINVKKMPGTFMNCTALQKAPALPVNVTDIDSLFKYCSNLNDISNCVIPDKVINMQGTFRDCPALQTLPDNYKLPDSVNSLNSTFYNTPVSGTIHVPCTARIASWYKANLTTVYYHSDSCTGTCGK